MRPPAPRARGVLLRLGGVAAAAVVAAAAYWATLPRSTAAGAPGAPPAVACAPSPPPRSRCEAALRVLGDARPGARVGDFTVELYDATQDGGIRVVLAAAAGDVQLEIYRADGADPAPPATAGAFSVYLARVAEGSRTPQDAGAGALALADALSRGGARPPAWLATFGAARSAAAGAARAQGPAGTSAGGAAATGR